MVNGTSQANYGLAFDFGSIVQQVVMLCQSCNWKQLWQFEKKNFPWVENQVQSACELLLFVHKMNMNGKHTNIDELMLITFKDGKDIKNNYKWWRGNDFDVKPIL